MSSATFAICKVLQVALAMALIGCAHSPSPSAGNPVISKAKKSARHPPSPEPPDNDYSVDYYGTSPLSRNLPLAGTKWEWEAS